MDHSDREPWKDAASCEKRRDKHPLSNAFYPKAHCGESPRARRLLSSAVGKPLTVNKNKSEIVRSGRDQMVRKGSQIPTRSKSQGKPEGAPAQITVAQRTRMPLLVARESDRSNKVSDQEKGKGRYRQTVGRRDSGEAKGRRRGNCRSQPADWRVPKDRAPEPAKLNASRIDNAETRTDPEGKERVRRTNCRSVSGVGQSVRPPDNDHRPTPEP